MPQQIRRRSPTRPPGQICTVSRIRRDICGTHATFLVRNQTLAYYLDNHHGDGIVADTCKALSDDNAAVASANPALLPGSYIVSRGWVTLRLEPGAID